MLVLDFEFDGIVYLILDLYAENDI